MLIKKITRNMGNKGFNEGRIYIMFATGAIKCDCKILLLYSGRSARSASSDGHAWLKYSLNIIF